jgi:hypothetical protein
MIRTVLSAVAVCTALLVTGACSATGQAAPPNFVVIPADDPGWGDMRANNPDRSTIASLAKSRGYATACIGKWHLGRKWPITPAQKSLFTGFGGKAGGGGSVSTEVTQAHRDAWQAVFSQPIPEGPTTRGFDQYFGTDVPNWPPYCFIENGRIRPAFRDQRSPTGNWNQFFRRLLIVLPPLFAPTPKRRAHSCSTCH